MENGRLVLWNPLLHRAGGDRKGRSAQRKAARDYRADERHRHRGERHRLRQDRRRRERRRGGGHKRHRRGRRDRPFPHLPGRGPRRRQDLRHAQRGPTPAGARHRRRRRVRRELRAAAHRGADQRPRGRPPQGRRIPGSCLEEMDLDAVLRRRPTSPWSTSWPTPTCRAPAEREALAGCPGAPRRGHQRHHHRQHPASGKHRR